MKKQSPNSLYIGVLAVLIGMTVFYLLTQPHEETKSSTQMAVSATTSNKASERCSPDMPIVGLEIPVLTAGQANQTIEHLAYTVGYNPKLYVPNWVAYVLTGEETRGEAAREAQFMPDPAVKDPVLHSDYTNNPGKYDRGHMAPAADFKYSAEAMRESFYTTNICPQNRNLNRGDWNDLEELVRDYARLYDSVYVVCGPLFKATPASYIGKRGHIAVPDAFFKALLRRDGNEWYALGFIFPNESGNHPLLTYMCSIDQIEEAVGIDLFPLLPDDVEERIEASVEPANWSQKRK